MSLSTESVLQPTVRELPQEEWSRLRHHDPFLSGGLPDPEHWRIIVAEVGETLVGFSCLYTAVHNEPIWIDEAYRHHPGLFKALWHETRTILESSDIHVVFAVVPDSLPRQQALVEKFGYQTAPGKLFMLDVSRAPEF